MGGFSSEVNISLKSGSVVYNNLDRQKYNPYQVHILKEKWVVVDKSGEYLIDKNDFSVVINDKKITFDCVFNAIHGTPGEDGYIIGYLELLGIPHTSCGMYQAALTFNKRDCLSVLKPYGIKTAESYYLNLGDVIDEDRIIHEDDKFYNWLINFLGIQMPTYIDNDTDSEEEILYLQDIFSIALVEQLKGWTDYLALIRSKKSKRKIIEYTLGLRSLENEFKSELLAKKEKKHWCPFFVKVRNCPKNEHTYKCSY